MKVWLAIPADYASARAYDRGVTLCTSALCPPRTPEMDEDNVYWFEADVLRRMEVPVLERDWEYRRERTLFYQWREPNDQDLYK